MDSLEQLVAIIFALTPGKIRGNKGLSANKQTRQTKTSPPLGAWKCNFPHFFDNMTESTNQLTDRATHGQTGS